MKQSYTSAELKKLSYNDLYGLAKKIREFIISAVSKHGGHLASSLGVVELTIALHRAFDLNDGDSIIWDVGHQCYAHKILTGRGEGFGSLREFGGLSGFPKFEEDRRDVFNTGHSSTSISAALGIAKSNELAGRKGTSIAVIGDGAMTGGMAFEAINHAGHNAKNLIIIYNDNGMSISKNVGGFSRAMKRLRTAASYLRFKDEFKSALDNIPILGAPTKKGLSKIKDDLKNMVVESSAFFESMGFFYMGPVDGHDIERLEAAFNYAKTATKPVFIHVRTKKGKGYAPAESDPDLYHGVGAFDVATGKQIKKSNRECWSDVFGDAICALAERDDKVVAVTAAMPLGTGLKKFAEEHPNKFFDVGIAEQHATTFSAGMARGGLKPIFAVYSTFLQRAYDQLLHDVALQNLHVVLAVDRSGPVEGDGETHQGVYDISYLSHMPNFTILSPSIQDDLEQMLSYALNINGPVVIRYPRGEAPTEDDIGVKVPKLGNNTLSTRIIIKAKNPDVLIVSVGIMLKNATKVAQILEEHGYSVSVADAVTIKPFDKKPIERMAKQAKIVVSIENNVTTGGFGSILEDALGMKILKFGYPDEPICQGKISEIEDKYGLSSEKIAKSIETVFKINKQNQAN